MRNLQKILALVLALVMSLSLMATAGARDFTDGDQIDETFAESVDVLTGLEVFQGYPSGDFQPKGDITRAEVAAIIYRIATGDVTDSQVGIYADYNKFSDVPSDNWAAGYINYCANAEYIKGRGDGKFYPQDKVTGYEALAMILRVVGYDKNGEFTGADWQVQTAATANQRKVTKNVNAGTLGNPASRETVAELLCQAILIEKVNYTLAFGYQISTDPQETIAYETFKMEKLEGVVTGNEIADLKTDKGTALGANQTRLVIDGREEVMNIPTGLDDIGECVRVYIRPENGTTRSNLVTSKVYSDGLNKVFTTSERVSSVGNTTGSEQGITSIEGAEHFINFDQADKYEARIRIRYVMQVRMSEYEAMLMYYQNGGNSVLYEINNGTSTKIERPSNLDNADSWDKLIRVAGGVYNYQYEKTIEAFADLTDTDYANIRSIFTSAGNNGTWTKGEVYVGTSNIANQDDVSDDIRWEDFIATYLKAEENKEQVESNGQGFLLKIIDNDNDGIAEYVLQTRYTVAKVAANGTGLDIANLKLTDSDMCNEVSASDKITVVSGTNLEASEDTVAAGDVVIYAMIDGTVRAQKAESETSRVTTINRAATPVTATIESGEKKQSAVHEHSEGLASGLTNMVIGTNYTVYFDLYGNIAAFTEGDVGGFVLVTDGWFNQTAAAREYAIQAYVDGALQTVNITNNGSLFINDGDVNNRWGALKTTFGTVTNVNEGNINYGGKHIHTIVATLEGNNLVPVDKSYRYSQTVRMLDIPSNTVPGINGTDANAYVTTYGVNATAYTTVDPDQASSKVYGRSDTVYYYVYKDGTKNTVTGQDNVVVRTYTGYSNIPSINSIYVEDVYAVGIRTNRNLGTTNPNYVYTADVVVVELNENYRYQNTTSEQVFIPGATLVNNNLSRVAGQGWETVTMIRGNGEVEDVTVDLNSSIGYEGYDAVGGRGRITAGLYYMDPIDTNSSVYAIRKMSNADIRANNYLTGYVDSSTILSNNWVQVETMTYQGYDAANNPNTPVESATLGIQGKKVDTENLYTLSGRTLTKALATTVFDQWPSIHVSNNNRNALNELYDKATDTFPGGRSNRNEVLVRYNGNSVVWAVSFAELDGSDVNSAQYTWYNNLVSDDNTVSSGVKFFGKDIVDNGLPTINDSVDYAVAKGNVIEFSNSIAATIQSWSLWRYSGTDYSIKLNDLNEQKNVDGARYKLEVTFVSGGSKTYYLTLNPANNVALALAAKATPSVGTQTDYMDNGALKVRTDMNVLDYTKQYVVTPSTAAGLAQSKVVWNFWTAEQTFTVESTVDAEGKIIDSKVTSGDPGTTGIMTNAITKATVYVQNERGVQSATLTYLKDGGVDGVDYKDVTLGRYVMAIYNGVTYRWDNQNTDTDSDGNPDITQVRVFNNTEIVLTTTTNEYGRFVATKDREIAVTDANNLSARVTITKASDMPSKISFESETPADVTPATGIQSGKINTVSSNVRLTPGAAIEINDDTIIDLQNNTLTIARNGDGFHVAAGKKLTIKGTGTLKLDGTGSLIGLMGGDLEIGAATLEAGDTYAIALFADSDGATQASTVTLDGTKINGNYGLTVNGSNSQANVLNLTNVVANTKGVCLYLAGTGTTTVSGGSFTAREEDAAIEARAGSVTIKDNAALTSQANPPAVDANGNGTTTTGSALAVVPHTTNNPVSVYVNGGTLTGAYSVTVANPNKSTGTCLVNVVDAALHGNVSVTRPADVSINPNVNINGQQYTAAAIGGSATPTPGVSR